MKNLSKELKEIHNSLVSGVVHRFNKDGIDIVSNVSKETNGEEDKVLGSWLRDSDLPIHVGDHKCVVIKDRLYMVGGSNGSVLNTVFYAPILEDGSLGTWVQDTNLPISNTQHECVVTKDRLYVMGGDDGSDTLNNVFYKTLTTD